MVGGSSSVRGIRAAVSAAVLAAVETDRAEFEQATQRLAGQDQQRLRLVQGQIVRELLEELHPDGLATAEAQDVLERCVRASIGWYPEVDPAVLVVALLGALNAPDPDDQPVLAPATVAAHGSLLIAELLAGRPGSGVASSAIALDRLLDRLLDQAFAEIQRAETIELP